MAEPALILIADDEEPIAEIVAYVVADAGHTPLIASHGRQALELALARQPALVITDLMMPYLTGAELIAAIRADAAKYGRAAPRFVLMTSAARSLARAANADAVLQKPFELVEIEALLAHLLAPRS